MPNSTAAAADHLPFDILEEQAVVGTEALAHLQKVEHRPMMAARVVAVDRQGVARVHQLLDGVDRDRHREVFACRAQNWFKLDGSDTPRWASRIVGPGVRN